jgi:hypothetical protein
MIRSLAASAFRLAWRAPSLWWLALLAGETGLVTILLPLRSPNLPGPLPALPVLTLPLILTLASFLFVFWLFSALAFNALVIIIARLSQSQPTAGHWSAALPHFWSILTLRLTYLLTLGLLLALLTIFAEQPLVWLAVTLVAGLAGILLNLASRAILLDSSPWASLGFLLAHRRWSLFKVWIGSEILSLLILLALLILILCLEVVALIVFLIFAHLPDPYYSLMLVGVGLLVSLPVVTFLASAGAFVNSYWTLAYLRLRAS